MLTEAPRGLNYFRFAANAHRLGNSDLAKVMVEEAQTADNQTAITSEDPYAAARNAARSYDFWDRNKRIGAIRLTPINSDDADNKKRQDQIQQIQTLFGIEPTIVHPKHAYQKTSEIVWDTKVPGIQVRARVNGSVLLFAEDPRSRTANPSGRDTSIPSFPGSK